MSGVKAGKRGRHNVRERGGQDTLVEWKKGETGGGADRDRHREREKKEKERK